MKRITEAEKALAEHMMEDCPNNDCKLYVRSYEAYRDLLSDLETYGLHGATESVIERAIRKEAFAINEMYLFNYAVKLYRRDNAI